ncbi:MAG: cytidylate kinase family protein, partial [Chloroflexi bacterium]|nr:cytidylate kinase family protein [Chloroflexota bacterium]
MGKIVIAAARTLGSGGEEVCAEAARRLRSPVLEREIITRAAASAGVSEDTVQEAERVPSFLARMVEL